MSTGSTGGSDLFIKDAAVLVGPELDYQRATNISVIRGKIDEIGAARRKSGQRVLTGKGLLVMPGLVNAHIHLNDAPLKDAGGGKSLEELIHPVTGLKNTGLRGLGMRERIEKMSAAVDEMVRGGITTAVDFHEEDISTIQRLRNANGNAGILVALGRPQRYFSAGDISSDAGFGESEIEAFRMMLEKFDGVSLSGANEYSNRAMEQVDAVRKGIVGIHAAESANTTERSIRMTGETEVERIAAHLRPDFVVHMTKATESDIQIAAKSRFGVVCCPRSNAMFGVGTPPIPQLMEHGFEVALGTDNIMVNSPDMFREMDFAARIARSSALDPSAVQAKEAVKMATVNGSGILAPERNKGITEGANADFAIIGMKGGRLSGTHDIYTALAHRAGPGDVAGTVKAGRLLFSTDALGVE